ncbi:MAG: HAD-IA family hydrolase, partial [Legionellales bacterium]|nr:HAD-IA family hydrolase [Legionellales bacterium]
FCSLFAHLASCLSDENYILTYPCSWSEFLSPLYFAQRHRLDETAILAYSHGRRTAETIAFFAPEHINVMEETAKVVAEEMLDLEGITAIQGAKKLLHSLPTHQWAIVTSANRELAIRRMRAADLPIPSLLITAEDVKQGKPAPDGYLLAAKMFQVLPKDCLVFEDACAGLIAANAAGIPAFAIGSHAQKTKTPHEKWQMDFTELQLTISPSKTKLFDLHIT